jgi:hypothetical protein
MGGKGGGRERERDCGFKATAEDSIVQALPPCSRNRSFPAFHISYLSSRACPPSRSLVLSVRLLFYSARDEAMLAASTSNNGTTASTSSNSPGGSVTRQHPLVYSWHHGLVAYVAGERGKCGSEGE